MLLIMMYTIRVKIIKGSKILSGTCSCLVLIICLLWLFYYTIIETILIGNCFVIQGLQDFKGILNSRAKVGAGSWRTCTSRSEDHHGLFLYY